MAVLNKRTRIVSFRVSEEEYSLLQRASLAEGARSISEYARKITCRVLPRRRSASTNLNALYARLDALEKQVRLLAVA